MSKPTPDPTYPAYAVGDTESGNEVTRVAAVTGLKSDQNQLADLLRRVISTAERPATKPEISDMAKLLQQLVREPLNRPPAVVNPPVYNRDHKFASSLSVNCHESHFHRLPTMKFASSLSVNCHDSHFHRLPTIN